MDPKLASTHLLIGIQSIGTNAIDAKLTEIDKTMHGKIHRFKTHKNKTELETTTNGVKHKSSSRANEKQNLKNIVCWIRSTDSSL